MGLEQNYMISTSDPVSNYSGVSTHSVGQRVLIRVIRRRALLDLLQQQRVFDQTAPWEIQEVPQVQLPAE